MKNGSYKLFLLLAAYLFFLMFPAELFSINTPQDTIKLNRYLQKANEYTSVSTDSAKMFFKKALELSQALNDKNKEANIHQEIGTLYRSQSHFDTARQHFQKALKIFRSLDDSLGIAKAFNNIGTVQFFRGSFKEAIQNYQKAIKLFEKESYDKGIADCKNNIGIIHWRQKNYDRAKEYLKEAAKGYKEIGNKTMQGYAYNNLGVIYGEEKNYEASLRYYQKAAQIFKKLGLQQLIQSTYQNMGIVNKNLGEYNKAMEYYNKSLNIAKKFKNKKLIASIHGNLSELYKAMADKIAQTRTQRKIYLNKAIEEGEKAIKISREIGAVPLLNTNAESQKKVYKEAGNYKKALEMAELYIETQDSLYSKEKTKAVEELEAQYQSEKKQLKIDKLEKEKQLQQEKVKRQRFLIITFIGGMTIVLIFSFIIYKQNQKRKKANYLLREKNEEIRKQKESIKEQADELRTLNATKNKFFSIIAHDLKNPFNTLLGYSKLLLENWDLMDKGKLKAFAEKIHSASEQGYDLLVNLLEWSRAQTGKLDINPQNFNLNDTIQQTISLLKLNADKKGIRIVDDTEENVFVYADMNSVTTTLRNLISNAIKYTPGGELIRLYSKTEKDQVKVFVEDNGMGIPAAYHKKIFRIDEGYSTKGTDQEGGTGLGLLLCKEFVEKNGGTIDFISEERKGTTFFFTLKKGNPQN